MELKEYFKQRYQGSESFLQNVVFPIFGEDSFDDGYNEPLLEGNPELETIARATGVASIERVGTIAIPVNPIDIFDIRVASHVQLTRNRVGVQQLVRRIMSTYSSAFMLFHYDDDAVWDWRFSFCSKRDNSDTTDSKRYTFLLGPGQSCRTAADNFQKLADKHGDIRPEDIQTAFDVEALSKEFFEKYKWHYERFVEYITGKRFVKEGGKWKEKTVHEPHAQMYAGFGSDDKRVRDYVKKLLGRIVFLHFLQKKGWLGVPVGKQWGEGDMQFMKTLFDHSSPEQRADYLDTVLEPLFAQGIDTEREDGLFDTQVSLPCGSTVRIPYLNGGLFERDALDEIPTQFPEEFFADLMDFFYQYNFTIDENDPNDAQVGVDPEMLGRIFENLLEDNKDKGAFYTPKEIVQYMCRQSLTAYLQTGIEGEADRNAIAEFVETYNVGALPAGLVDTIDERLKDVKICDPAIGSGAFPMGLLKELFLCRGAIEDFSNSTDIKRHIIQNNIYGVDIERGAVDIARLRFWLSLVVDEETPEALPNLDYKIMQGNSLLEQYQGVDLSAMTERKKLESDSYSLFENMLDVYRKELRDKLSSYYDCDNHDERKALRQEMAGNVKQQLTEQGCRIDFGDLDLAANTEFFLWHTWFYDVFVEGGFDIVIGNPPYVKIEGIPTADRVIYKKTFSCFEKRTDLFALFLEKALLQLSNTQGVVTFIIPSVIHSNLSYNKLRNIFLDNRWLQEVCYTGGDVFNAPTVDTTILRFNKQGNKQIVLKNAINFSSPTVSVVGSDYFKKFNNIISVSCDNSASIMDKLYNEKFDTLEAHYGVFQGIVTGNNTAFIFDTEEEALAHGIDKSLLHPLCHGRDIEKYAVRSHERRILYLNNSIDIEQYPKTKEWLLPFKEKLNNRREAKKGTIRWYSLQWPRIKSELDKKEKIWVQRTRNEALKIRMVAALDTQGCYSSEGMFNIISLDDTCNLRYLLAILNSRLLNYLFATKLLNLAIKGEYLKQLRVPAASSSMQAELSALAQTIIDKKQASSDTSSEELLIDLLIYRLYGLTYDEVLVVDPETPITREEYENHKTEETSCQD